MKNSWLPVVLSILVLLAAVYPQVHAGPYLDEDDYDQLSEQYSDNTLDRMLQPAQKRACIRRGGNCDHRPNDCCYNSSCRCNLWGSNCRCQRVGLFQKWG
ncbi:uncharacterized protein LOC108739741 isoform X4 [Agrilus planipennis]|uniref:Uncharacterized protein LOC108739741 isoform X3 n=1 Tax=Agrilus planipennis TaxID=224129 RepID=A0A1W4WZH9_AGRPL|nr:uncharacterized protein LOC108739741 isoform X3 [Agrilus planipennis]XP_025835984.1 uncharacterized protein LOC108739741 isoform X4 [Agrilus planipennis]